MKFGIFSNGLRTQKIAADSYGTLLIVMGKDWGTAKSRARSMKLFMEEVAPRLARLDANRAKQPTGAAPPVNPGSATLTAAAY
ncbi:MAG: hypothetical protein EXR27_18240 [Betaproteobacteria bacterium]|nr:hypothetical protein [Betaproteobacteria bacterium]